MERSSIDPLLESSFKDEPLNSEFEFSELKTLPATAEYHHIISEWNRSNVNYPANRCVHQLFEAQVIKTPQATAIVFEDKELTYA
jgi:non-ribosomal peptide synthetase component F